MTADLDPRDFLHVPCDCMEPMGAVHCHLCSDAPPGKAQEWPCEYADAQAAFVARAQADYLERVAVALREDGAFFVDPGFLDQEARTLRDRFEAPAEVTPTRKARGRA